MATNGMTRQRDGNYCINTELFCGHNAEWSSLSHTLLSWQQLEVEEWYYEFVR